MDILVLGGTRFFGKPMIEALLDGGHKVTTATRGRTANCFGDRVQQLLFDRSDAQSVQALLEGKHYDVIIDKIAYSSMDIRRIATYIDCDLYVLMSTTAVYDYGHLNICEDEFDSSASTGECRFMERVDADYQTGKRYAEKAAFRYIGNRGYRPSPRIIAVRYPFVIGPNDYTGRLKFYVESIINRRPLNIDNPDSRLSFIFEDEAGKFMAHLATSPEARIFFGPINGCQNGTVSIREITEYISSRTGIAPMYSKEAPPAPYNSATDHSFDIEFAAALGYEFRPLVPEIFMQIDALIDEAMHNRADNGTE